MNSDGECVANTTCNTNSTCLVCPYGYAMLMANTNTKLTQNCSECNVSSNCARCNISETSQCYTCPMGWYLNGSTCVKCMDGCSECISAKMCVMCSSGYIQTQSGSVNGNMGTGLLNCTLCLSPCATCSGSPSTCTSC